MLTKDLTLIPAEHSEDLTISAEPVFREVKKPLLAVMGESK